MHDTHSLIAPLPARPAAVRPRAGLREGLARYAAQLRWVVARQRQRHALARLDARLLRDVGLSVEQARAEAAKPPWRD